MIIRISGTSHKSEQKSANNEWDLTKKTKNIVIPLIKPLFTDCSQVKVAPFFKII